MWERRELYQSPNGDSWHLGREPANGRALLIHQRNGPSDGRDSEAFSRQLASTWPSNHRIERRLLWPVEADYRSWDQPSTAVSGLSLPRAVSSCQRYFSSS